MRNNFARKAMQIVSDYFHHREILIDCRQICVEKLAVIKYKQVSRAGARLKYNDPQFADLIFDVSCVGDEIKLNVYNSFISEPTCLAKNWNGFKNRELAYRWCR